MTLRVCMYIQDGCFAIAENSNGKVKAQVLSRSLLGGWQQQGIPGRGCDLWKFKKLGSKRHRFSVNTKPYSTCAAVWRWASGQWGDRWVTTSIWSQQVITKKCKDNDMDPTGHEGPRKCDATIRPLGGWWTLHVPKVGLQDILFSGHIQPEFTPLFPILCILFLMIFFFHLKPTSLFLGLPLFSCLKYVLLWKCHGTV